jgi:hypothetical protein
MVHQNVPIGSRCLERLKITDIGELRMKGPCPDLS